MEFVKGFLLEDAEMIFEGNEVIITTVQGVVIQGTLVSASKKRMGIQIEGEIELRVFNNENITKIAQAE